MSSNAGYRQELIVKVGGTEAFRVVRLHAAWHDFRWENHGDDIRLVALKEGEQTARRRWPFASINC